MAELEKSSTLLDEQAQLQGLRGAFQRHPVRSALVIFAIDLLLVTSFTLAAAGLVTGVEPDFIALILVSLVTLLVLSLLRWWKVVGFNRPAHWRNLLLLALPALVVAVLPLAQGVAVLPGDQLSYFLLAYLLVGFHEEAVYRGIILRLLRPGGLVQAVALSSLLFGLAHAANLLVSSNPALVLAQMVGAAAEGVGFAALRIRTHTLWFLILLHAAQDLLLHYTNLPLIPVTVAQSVFFLIFGILILRSRLKKERASLSDN